MQMIFSSSGKSKKRKPSAKQRELSKSWADLIKKYEPKQPLAPAKATGLKYSPGNSGSRETTKIPSLPFSAGPCVKKANPIYTGTKVMGIGTMHKSNAVPIFSNEEAHDIATMRRN